MYVTVCVFLPNQACWSPCTSIARPKSASFTAAPFILLANNRFSGWRAKCEAECGTRDQKMWETHNCRHSSIKLFLRNIFMHSAQLVWGRGKGVMERQSMGKDGWAENLHNTIYGHGFVAIETTRESFRQRCRRNAKWKVYLVRGRMCASVLNGSCLGRGT